jgi:hypothetical protein
MGVVDDPNCISHTVFFETLLCMLVLFDVLVVRAEEFVAVYWAFSDSFTIASGMAIRFPTNGHHHHRWSQAAHSTGVMPQFILMFTIGFSLLRKPFDPSPMAIVPCRSLPTIPQYASFFNEIHFIGRECGLDPVLPCKFGILATFESAQEVEGYTEFVFPTLGGIRLCTLLNPMSGTTPHPTVRRKKSRLKIRILVYSWPPVRDAWKTMITHRTT